ncbi:hypothetical protein D3C87_1776080 [compost metagenome]
MQPAVHRSADSHAPSPEPRRYPPLESEDRPVVETAAAAHYLGRRPNTLRIWSCSGTGPLTPIRVNGRLAWRVSEIRRLLEVSA